MSNDTKPYGFSTLAIHAGETVDFSEGATCDVVSPIHLSTTFAWKNPTTPGSAFEYTRSQNPTRKLLETRLAALEKGEYALAFSSGSAAEAAVLQALLRSGDHIVAFDDLYGGTKRLFDDIFPGLEVSYIDASDANNVKKAIRQNTRMIWMETPTNPMIKVCDIAAIAAISRENNLVMVVDNTFLSPCFQQPLTLGADVVLHSATKFIGGHSDVLGGAVICNDPTLYEKIHAVQNAVGAVLAPFDCYLTLRGIKTLSLRMKAHEQNALAIARFLEAHPKIKRVYYPGLESHPQYELSKKQTRGSGGLLSFEMAGTNEDACRLLGRLQLFTTAESLGGVESLIEIPATMTHLALSPEARALAGITDTLIRVSVGIEDTDDLLDDLKNALAD